MRKPWFQECLVLSVVLALSFSAVHAQSPANLLGTWQAKEGAFTLTLILNADGTGKIDDESMKYAVKDNVLSVDEKGHINRYAYQLNGNKMTLSGGDLDKPMAFERQEPAPLSGLGARRAQPPAAASVPSDPAGSWETSDGIKMVLNQDGSGTFASAGPVRWKFSQQVLSLTFSSGTTMMYSAALTENSLTLSSTALPQALVFQPVRAGAAPVVAAATPDTGGTGLVGRWQGPQGLTQINADGTMLINDVPYRYIVQGSVLMVIGRDGSTPIPFQLRGNSLTITTGGQSAVLQRMAANTAAPPNTGSSTSATSATSAAELAGKWCYVSTFNANAGGGSMTDECFTLNANGSYSYHREASMSAYAPGIWGGTSSQTNDAGTFQVLGTKVTVNSRTQGTKTYTLEKRNHPKTGDPMICLEGTCFVTSYQRPPWR